ncbi:MAG: FliM/FliN family flagellar motor switch protein [Acidovorax sp.]|nr:FliM/FliN family flagellar motor switch protein [Acidovorax sp.]
MQSAQFSAVLHPVLDARTLGRPVHLLAPFARKFGADLSDLLRQGMNRRYGTRLAVAEARMVHRPASAAPRWQVYGMPQGRMGVAMERELLLRLLQCRYGVRSGEVPDPATIPLTATEDRLARRLGEDIVAALVLRVQAGLAALAMGPQPDAEVEGALQWLAQSRDAVGAWSLVLTVEEPGWGLRSEVQVGLDDAWMERLLAQLTTGRTQARRERLHAETHSLAGRIPVRLSARLLRRRITLGEVMDLRPGDVIPVSFQSADVLVKDSRLFTATVAEHKGGLWLTAFNDAA